MSSCLSGGGRAFSLGHEMIKSPSSSWVSNSSSPSFTDSSNSSVSISTRKARTPRKRPNQVYNEAAAILSSACPKIFPTKHLTKPDNFAKPHKIPFPFDHEELFTPFKSIDSSKFSLHSPVVSRLNFPKELSPIEKPCQSPGEISSHGDYIDVCDELGKDFDAESILDDGFEDGIDSIMGKLSVKNECCDSVSSLHSKSLGIGLGYGIRKESRAIRNADEEDDWWRFPTVDAVDITQSKALKVPEEKKKKVTRKSLVCVYAKSSSRLNDNKISKCNSSVSKATSKKTPPQSNAGLLLNLNYDAVIESWGHKGSPFLGDASGSDPSRNVAQMSLTRRDLFASGVEAESPVSMSKEKPNNTKNSMKHQFRKVNATDQRRRPKARFMKLSDTICEGSR